MAIDDPDNIRNNKFDDPILKGMEFCHPVKFRYKSGDDATKRLVSPWEIIDQGNSSPKLLAYDHNREGIRTFFLEEIHHPALDDSTEYVFPQESDL